MLDYELKARAQWAFDSVKWAEGEPMLINGSAERSQTDTPAVTLTFLLASCFVAHENVVSK